MLRQKLVVCRIAGAVLSDDKTVLSYVLQDLEVLQLIYQYCIEHTIKSAQDIVPDDYNREEGSAFARASSLLRIHSVLRVSSSAITATHPTQMYEYGQFTGKPPKQYPMVKTLFADLGDTVFDYDVWRACRARQLRDTIGHGTTEAPRGSTPEPHYPCIQTIPAKQLRRGIPRGVNWLPSANLSTA